MKCPVCGKPMRLVKVCVDRKHEIWECSGKYTFMIKREDTKKLRTSF